MKSFDSSFFKKLTSKPDQSPGSGEEVIFEQIEIDTDGGSGSATLPSFSLITEGFLYLYTLSTPGNGAYLFADSGDTIDGSSNIEIKKTESLLIQRGSSEWEEVARGPSRVITYLAEGGDIITLPQLSVTPSGTVVYVFYNNTGTGDPVEVYPFSGDTISPLEYSNYIFDLYDSTLLIHDGMQWVGKSTPSTAALDPRFDTHASNTPFNKAPKKMTQSITLELQEFSIDTDEASSAFVEVT